MLLRGAYVEMMRVEFMEPLEPGRKIIEYERSHPMPADPFVEERVDTHLLFDNGRWRKDVPLQKALEVMGRLPVAARLIRVAEEDHHFNVELKG